MQLQNLPAELKALDLLSLKLTAPPKPPMLFPGFRRTTGLGLIIAAGGTGKSFLALQLAAELAAGQNALDTISKHQHLLGGAITSDPVRTIYIGAEDPEWAIADRLHAMASLYPPDVWRFIDLHASFFTRAKGSLALFGPDKHGNLTHYPFLDAVRSLMQQADIIILDNLSRFHRLDSENNPAHIAQMYDQLYDIALDTGCDIIMLHHTAQWAILQKNHDAISARGATMIVDGARFVITMGIPDDTDREKWEQAGTVQANDALIVGRFAKASYSTQPTDVVWRRDVGTGLLLPVVAATVGSKNQNKRAKPKTSRVSRVVPFNGAQP